MKIRIMNYNVFVGFHDIKKKENDKVDFVFNKSRLKAAKRIVKKENPDILILTEANFGGINPKGKFVDYKKEFRGYNYGWHGSPWNISGMLILSKYEITDTNLFRFKGSYGFKSKIKIKDKELIIDCIQPQWDGEEAEKIEFAKIILQDKKTPYILTGDFNSLSDEDEYDKEKMFKVFERILGKDEGIKVAKRLLEKKFVPFLKSQGLIDASKKSERRFTIPTDLVDKEKLSPLRLDYFFTTPETIIKTKVITGKDAEKASDHYPIVAEVEI